MELGAWRDDQPDVGDKDMNPNPIISNWLTPLTNKAFH
ncbi:hypothetical protein CCACVL1_04443 [Corchorus capsularis]|uniref:Uncharacterized protein n=1 Tax=Corchorus capsularis TaxID=210143 RepID=A0A1R3JSD4_COCAP|nr:hypothetical protein CCACVL1_04443 [Corchorus capsularis]